MSASIQATPDQLTELATSHLNTGRALLNEATNHPGKERNKFLTAVAAAWFEAADVLTTHKTAALDDVQNAAHCLRKAVLFISTHHPDSAQQRLTDAHTYLYAAAVAGRISRSVGA
jgi:uncharacterized protein (DUF1778 family)